MTDADHDIPQDRLAESAERVIARALEEARRWEHGLLTNLAQLLGGSQRNLKTSVGRRPFWGQERSQWRSRPLSHPCGTMHRNGSNEHFGRGSQAF